MTKELAKNNVNVWEQGMVRLLEDMHYIICEKGRLRLNYPIFADHDKKIVEQIADIILPLVTQAIRQNYSALEKALGNIIPAKNKVAFNEILNEAWHWIFAQTNKILAEKGFLYNPPKSRRSPIHSVDSKFRFSLITTFELKPSRIRFKHGEFKPKIKPIRAHRLLGLLKAEFWVHKDYFIFC